MVSIFLSLSPYVAINGRSHVFIFPELITCFEYLSGGPILSSSFHHLGHHYGKLFTPVYTCLVFTVNYTQGKSNVRRHPTGICAWHVFCHFPRNACLVFPLEYNKLLPDGSSIPFLLTAM